MIRRIMMVVPPNKVPLGNLRRIGEPLGVLSIATYLKSKGFKVNIYDMTLEGYDNCKDDGIDVVYGSDLDELKERIIQFQPDLLGVSTMFTFKEGCTLTVCSAAKEVNPNIIVVVGGMPPTMDSESYLDSSSIDYVIMNDGEVRLERLIYNLNNSHRPEENLDGIAYRDTTCGNEMVIIPSKEINAYFSVVPYPDRSLVDMDKYFKINRPYAPFCSGRRVAHIVTSKGCPFNCIFCAAVHFVGNKIRERTIENISLEIQELVNKFGVEELQFMDDNLTINKDFATRLFKEIKKFNIKWCTPNGLYFNSLDEELLEMMAQSGCYQITLAVESASQRLLDEVIGKSVCIDSVKTLVDKAHAMGLSVHGLFVVGIPGETAEELHKTLRFPFENNFDSVSFSLANAFEGSRLWELCYEQGYEIRDKTKGGYGQTNFIIPQNNADYVMSPESLAELVDRTSKEFFEWSKNAFPDIWEKKYHTFLQNTQEKEENVNRRI